MILNNYKNIAATFLQADDENITGLLMVKGTDGETYYACANYDESFPNSVSDNLVKSATDAGIVLGTGMTPATVLDYKIETVLSGSYSAEIIKQSTTDLNGNPYIKYKIAVKNNGSSTLTIHEIAYNQVVSVTAAKGAGTAVKKVVCLEHTVFDNDVNIPAGETRLINYTLKTIPAGNTPVLMSKTITENGVYEPDEGYDGFSVVTVSTSASASMVRKQIDENGIYTASSEGVGGYYEVVVSVPAEMNMADEGKVVHNKSLISQTALSITNNGEYDTMFHDTVTVDLTSQLSSIEISVNGSYYPDGCFGFSEVKVNIQPGESITSRENALIEGTLDTYENNEASKISNYAFFTSHIRTVTMNNVQAIGSHAFESTWLQIASFPACINISQSAFYNCKSISTAYFSECLSIGPNAFWNASSLKYIGFPKCTSIGTSAFYSTKISSANFPELLYLAAGAFEQCTSLKTIDMPKCSYIGSSAFIGCTSLTGASLPECSVIERDAFSGCRSLSFAYIPMVTSLSIGALRNTSKLADVDITSCQYIGSSAFYRCGLLSVNGPEVLSINSAAFYSCPSLTYASFPKCNTLGSSAFGYCAQLSAVNLESCTSLSAGCFSYCSALETINLPNCVNVGESAFYRCISLSSVNLPICTSIGSSVFIECIFESISIPNCSIIGRSAFMYCSALSGIDAPNCSSIGEYAFASCSALTFVRLSTCVSLLSNTFAYCASLQTVDIPACTLVSAYAFLNCVNLSSANLPKCQSISTSAFYGCSNLMAVYLSEVSSVAKLANSSVFGLTPLVNSTYTGEFGSVYVPESLVEAFRASTYWSTIASRITAYIGE